MKIEDIDKIDYSELVALVKERNRPSGGIKTIQEVAVNSFIDSNKKMLEIGSNTGFTCVNMSLLTGCESVGVDINKDSIKEAKRFAKLNQIENNVSFMQASAEKLPFEDNLFDIVWCSNVTSFINNKEKVVEEYLRVLDFKGYLILIPIYYIKPPSTELVDKVSEAIDSRIEIRTKQDWINLFNKIADPKICYLEKVYDKDYLYEEQTSERVHEYCEEVINKSNLNFTPKINAEICKRYTELMNLFNINLQYCGYSIIIFQKRHLKDESELFLTKELK